MAPIFTTESPVWESVDDETATPPPPAHPVTEIDAGDPQKTFPTVPDWPLNLTPGGSAASGGRVRSTTVGAAVLESAGTVLELLEPSPYWGNEPVAISRASAHSLMMDSKGRLWTAARTRQLDNPAFCKAGSSNPFAINFPIKSGSRQTNFYDPKTGKWTLVDMCASSQLSLIHI